MNRFSKIAEKLISNPLWTSSVEIVQLKKSKNENGHVIYVKDKSVTCNCVSKSIRRNISDDKFGFATEVIVSSNDLKDLKLDKNTINVIYQDINYSAADKTYSLVDIICQGILNNESCVVSFILKS